MLIPYQANIYIEKEPKSNLIIILLMIIFYLFSLFYGEDAFSFFVLTKENIILGSLASWLWHTDFYHLLGNILFLWTFGNAICAKIGNVLYAITFIGLSFITGIVHIYTDGSSAEGASGAINGIVGMFLFLYPFEHISCVWMLSFKVNTVEIKSIYLIILWFIYDIISAFFSKGQTGYIAHISGFVIGFIIMIVMVKFSIVQSNNSDRTLF
jgi:membrane associated rhomboid family serine protease